MCCWRSFVLSSTLSIISKPLFTKLTWICNQDKEVLFFPLHSFTQKYNTYPSISPSHTSHLFSFQFSHNQHTESQIKCDFHHTTFNKDYEHLILVIPSHIVPLPRLKMKTKVWFVCSTLHFTLDGVEWNKLWLIHVCVCCVIPVSWCENCVLYPWHWAQRLIVIWMTFELQSWCEWNTPHSTWFSFCLWDFTHGNQPHSPFHKYSKWIEMQ